MYLPNSGSMFLCAEVQDTWEINDYLRCKKGRMNLLHNAEDTDIPQQIRAYTQAVCALTLRWGLWKCLVPWVDDSNPLIKLQPLDLCDIITIFYSIYFEIYTKMHGMDHSFLKQQFDF